MKDLKDIISQAGMTEKDFAWNLKYMVDTDHRTGTEVLEMVNEQTGLSLTKDELYSFLLEHCKNPDGEAFSIENLKRWEK